MNAAYLKHICLTLTGKTQAECMCQTEGAVFAELRHDLIAMNPAEVIQLMEVVPEWIVSVRRPFLDNPVCLELFSASLKGNVRFVDIDAGIIKHPAIQPIISEIRKSKAKLLLSYHDFDRTPPAETLKSICRNMFCSGADAVKVACIAHDEKEVNSLLELYNSFSEITAFCLGDPGRRTRVEALYKGLRISYAYPDHGTIAAPGQYSFSEMCNFAETVWKKGLLND